MQELQQEQLLQYLKEGRITSYNIYNLEMDYSQYYSVQYYLNSDDSIEKKQLLNILFIDIEVYTSNYGKFPNIESADFPISSITIYSTFEKIYRSFFLVNKNTSFNNKQEIEKEFKNKLKEQKYIDDNDNILIEFFTDELSMIQSCWSIIHTIDPVILSGWASDIFDIPYMYYRLKRLIVDDYAVNKILSKFGSVRVRQIGNSKIISIAEFPICDLLYAYKPRDDRGLNYGSKEASYSLDWMSKKYLDLKKLEFKNEGDSLDTFYEKDPINYLLYNIIDVCLTTRLNQKFRHIELHNTLRRLMKTSFDRSLRGPSVLFDTYVLYELSKNNKKVRFGIANELVSAISSQKINQIPKPKSKVNWNKNSVDISIFRNVISRFPGAYVKQPKPQIVTERDGIITDLDAISLYPSMILQNNISFDTFYGRVIDPIVYKTIDMIRKTFEETKKFPDQLYSSILDFIIKHVSNNEYLNKNDAIQYLYYILSYLFHKLEKNIRPISNIFNPQSQENYIILKRYVIQILDLMAEIHPKAKEYNTFIHDYLLNNEINIDNIYIIENVNEPTLKIIMIKAAEFEKYLKDNNLIISISGILTLKHDLKKGLFTKFLIEMKEMRNKYKKERDLFSESSEDYKFYDARQNSVKITMNTLYGLYGLSTYRYSSKHLAKAVTTQGRTMLKIAQLFGEGVLNDYKI